MIEFNDLKDIKDIEPCAVAMGNFDGVHLGHRRIIAAAVEKARELGIKSAVFTFSNHPKNLIPGHKPVKNIIYREEKASLIEKLGVDYLFNIEFTRDILVMEPAEFIAKLLVEKFHAAEVFCGFNYRFGYKAAGTAETLAEEGKRWGFNCNQLPPVTVDGEVVSSTLIRSLIKSGEVDECYKYLGRNYDIEGEVVVGNKLGRTIGFPTSNITIDETMVTPPNGVYITNCIYNGVKYPSVTNIGVKPTVGRYAKNVETHIFNFDKELYGKTIRIEFLKMTRVEVKFGSVDELAEQISRDCRQARAFHGLSASGKA